MKYNIFCEKCGYKTEIDAPMKDFGEEYLKKIKCKECKTVMKRLITDMAFAMTGYKTNSKRDAKSSKKSIERMGRSTHERKVGSDPYYDCRKD